MRHLFTSGASLALVAIAITTGVLTGCGQTQSPVGFTNSNGNDQQIFSNRPIAPRPQVLTVHLSSPALLTVGTKTSDGWVIPASAKQMILAEQGAFISQVKSINPSIQILYRYRLVLNAVTLVASSDFKAQIQGLIGVTSVEVSGLFNRPTAEEEASGGGIPSPTSVDFIGATEAQKNGIDGSGVRVGIIDTGIDYTHKMLGGHGDPAEYAAIKPDQPTPLFPNDKVVGGIDLVGSDYDAASELPIHYIPKPDANPLDEAGHGTHVAGTVAGVGDGVNTYTGVAPKAKLYAIKVFGKGEGSTSDAAVIAGLEYAADPTGTMNPNNQLDVVNLSLGGNYGSPHILYAEAVRNLSNAGTAVVAAAGNSGPQDNIVGAPGTAKEALSVAASIDGAPVNWRFPESQITDDGKSFFVKATEGSISKPVAQCDGIQGSLVFIGLGDKPVEEPLKSKVKGNVALMVRGGVPFAQKLQVAADAGAIGVVVINNKDGDAVQMGGDGHVDIPAIMITLDVGKQISQDMDAGKTVSILFKTSQIVEEPQRIDTITSFSSKGPRSEDDLIKPEIAAPGSAVLSAAMGKGTLGVRMDGTSMATPHMTGVMALLKQAHPDLSVADLKALVMNNAKVLSDTSQKVYPISMQGAGRVQVLNALAAKGFATPSISLGLIQSSAPKTIVKPVRVTNLTGQPQTYQVTYQGSTYLKMQGPSSVQVAPNSSSEFDVAFTISGLDTKALADEADGRVILKNGPDSFEIPALAMRTEISAIQVDGVQAGDKSTVVNLENTGLTGGEALAFNLLGQGKRKHATGPTNNWMSRSCNLKSAGYRFVQVPTNNGSSVTRLQFAFELFDPLTTWNYCELNVQFDLDGDGQADYELAGVSAATVGSDAPGFASVLLNATKSRQIRTAFERKIRQGLPVPNPDYSSAMISAEPMVTYDNSTIAVVQVDVSRLGIQGKTVGIKVAVTNDDTDNALEPDDFLTQNYQTLSIDPLAQAYTDLPFDLQIDSKAKQSATFTRGTGQEPLVIYLPENVAGNTSRIIQ